MARRIQRRRGRQRKTGPRTKFGQLSRAYKSNPACRDTGTPEAEAKRLALVNGSGDQTLASSLADILFAHKILGADQRDAAIRFRAIRERIFPHPLKNGQPGRMPSEEQIAENEKLYDKLIRRMDEDQRLAVVDLILENRASWIRRHLLGVPLTDEDQLEKAALLSGLDRLAGRQSAAVTGEERAAA